jgi:glyoxalase family protein
VKKTVNFDDPKTYHFYYGNERGEAGTILTFFPWQGIPSGQNGKGMATHIAYAIPKGALDFWRERLQNQGISIQESSYFGEHFISFDDPDGLQLILVEVDVAHRPTPWAGSEIPDEKAIRGFHHTTLTLQHRQLTSKILTEVLGYKLLAEEGNRFRFGLDTKHPDNYIDILEDPAAPRALMGAGINHHIAFRVKSTDELMELRQKIVAANLNVTPKIDRQYFYSLYFREPGGVLFEIATDEPGFTVDEPLNTLGSELKLPPQYQSMREELEQVLPKIG